MSTTNPPSKPHVTPVGLILSLLLGALAGAGIMAAYNKYTAQYTSVAILEVGASNPSSTRPEDIDIVSANMGMSSPAFFAGILSGQHYPAPTGVDGLSAADFAARAHIQQIPGQPKFAIQYTASSSQDAISAVNAIIQNYLSTLTPAVAARASFTQPSTPAVPAYPVAATAKGAMNGAALCLILYTGYKIMGARK
jgi:hypothetical protein